MMRKRRIRKVTPPRVGQCVGSGMANPKLHHERTPARSRHGGVSIFCTVLAGPHDPRKGQKDRGYPHFFPAGAALAACDSSSYMLLPGASVSLRRMKPMCYLSWHLGSSRPSFDCGAVCLQASSLTSEFPFCPSHYPSVPISCAQ